VQNWWIYPASYLVGAIPFGVLVARAHGVDILNTGSGNPGATNIYRTIGPASGIVVFILDALKGALPAFGTTMLTGNQTYAFLAGMCAIIGHTFSPFIKFKGGKGIATGFGAVLGTQWVIALTALSCFIIMTLLTRFVSVGSITAAIVLPVLGFLFHVDTSVLIAFSLMSILILFKHRENVKRLLNGTENRFSFKSKST
jgi:glycerol-3-phosphate acyltransferase PlsY